MDDHIILVDKANVSDDVYKVTDVYAASGTEVRQGDMIGSFETSKADIDVEAPQKGYVHHRIQKGAQIRVGDIFAVISDSKDFPEVLFKKHEQQQKESAAASAKEVTETDNSGRRISKPAAELIAKHNIDVAVFGDVTIIGRKEVEEYLTKGTSSAQPANISVGNDRGGILIIGGGGHAKACIDIIRQARTHNLAGLTDTVSPIGSQVMGVPVLGTNDDFKRLYEEGIRYAVLGIGALAKMQTREDLYNQLKSIGYIFPNIIHPKAMLEPSCVLGDGNQVFAGAIIGTEVRIGNNCIINTGTILSHECVLGDNIHLTPGAILAGSVTVGNNSIIGMGATVLLKVKIGANVVVTNGVNVFNDVEDGKTVRS